MFRGWKIWEINHAPQISASLFFSVSHRGLYLNMDNQHSFFFTLALFVASVAVVVIVLMKKWSACKAKLLSISSLSHGNFFSKILIMTVALSLSLSLSLGLSCVGPIRFGKAYYYMLTLFRVGNWLTWCCGRCTNRWWYLSTGCCIRFSATLLLLLLLLLLQMLAETFTFWAAHYSIQNTITVKQLYSEWLALLHSTL